MNAREGLTRVATHGRRFLPLYIALVVWVAMVVAVPTTRPDDRLATGGSGPSDAGDDTETADGTIAADAVGGDAGATPGGATGASGSGANGATSAARAAAAAGRTRGGVDCKPGVRQLPGSLYAAPCTPAWSGSNGAATWRGVTADTIKVVARDFTEDPSSQAATAILEAAGQASREEGERVRLVFLAYFNRMYELYGRKVVIEKFKSGSSEVSEASNRGREEACADATAIAEERKAFATIPPAIGLGYGQFSECAAEKQLVVPVGPYGFPESWYRRYHPFVWGIQTSCDRIAYQVAEYLTKRLAGRKARWARDPVYTTQPRKFGIVVPDVGAYGECIDLGARLLAAKGVTYASRYSYTVDPTTMPQQAAQAVIQMKAAGVTSVILATDFIMTLNLTQQAGSQAWGPEWLIQGVGFQDYEPFVRLYNQDRVDGHLFGLSELGTITETQGPTSEAGRLYKQLTGTDLPQGAAVEYYTLLHLFNMLQAAGPNLSPATIGAGMYALPPGGPPGVPAGLWSFRTGPDGAANVLEHTAVDDAREVYWLNGTTGGDGRQGAFASSYNGRRFTNGEWPAEEPPVYPGR